MASNKRPTMTSSEVAEFLTTSEQHVRRMGQRGDLRQVKLGTGKRPRVRFVRADVERLIAGEVPADD
jgi:excisionase family DNA binding protein